MNQALERIAQLREKRLMLPTTVEKYLHYQELIHNVDYQYDNEGNVVLINNNDEIIHGFTLISKTPIDIISINHRESNGEYIIWFDFGPKEQIIIK